MVPLCALETSPGEGEGARDMAIGNRIPTRRRTASERTILRFGLPSRKLAAGHRVSELQNSGDQTSRREITADRKTAPGEAARCRRRADETALLRANAAQFRPYEAATAAAPVCVAAGF